MENLSGIENFQTFHRTRSQNYYVLEYDQEDKLYVPVGLERKLSRYVGFQDPKVSRLGSSVWQKTKRAIKEEVEKMAKDLLKLYAEKEIVQRASIYRRQRIRVSIKVRIYV